MSNRLYKRQKRNSGKRIVEPYQGIDIEEGLEFWVGYLNKLELEWREFLDPEDG
ncbi:unnamed protein product [Lupinus luteus]|uniref:Uncharacterized protein n=1 Tax=Lupinus luteus TaxID=3873 RepID=A0AAV1Y0Q8_LUPLU